MESRVAPVDELHSVLPGLMIAQRDEVPANTRHQGLVKRLRVGTLVPGGMVYFPGAVFL